MMALFAAFAALFIPAMHQGKFVRLVSSEVVTNSAPISMTPVATNAALVITEYAVAERRVLGFGSGHSNLATNYTLLRSWSVTNLIGINTPPAPSPPRANRPKMQERAVLPPATSKASDSTNTDAALPQSK